MAKTIEPPILMSRILPFVLSASVVVLCVLLFTLFKMIPLERPEVFFLLTQTRSTNVIIEPLTPDANNKKTTELYVRGFVREYIMARNQLDLNANITKNNWNKVVKPWSSKDTFKTFVNTALYRAYYSNQIPVVSCSVEFSNKANDPAIVLIKESDEKIDYTYHVNFMWVCKNIGRQTPPKNYKIQIRIQSDLDGKASGVSDYLEKVSANPLGIQVTQYTVLDGKADPLNSEI